MRFTKLTLFVGLLVFGYSSQRHDVAKSEKSAVPVKLVQTAAPEHAALPLLSMAEPQTPRERVSFGKIGILSDFIVTLSG